MQPDFYHGLSSALLKTCDTDEEISPALVFNRG
jgi:hypothetical protein